MPQPLTVRILSRSAVTMLVQVLAEDNSAAVTALDTAPLPPDTFGSQRERIRITWEGEKGSGQGTFVLHGLPDVSWSEDVNPNLPAPAPVLFVESDLPDAFTMLSEGFVASGRRRGERPAWLLREDWAGIPTLKEGRKEKGEHSDALLSPLLEKTAAFHALHWGAGRVLDEVYPWLPRFEDWVGKEREAGRAKSEETAELLAAVAGMPRTIIHGTWRAENLRLRGDMVLVDGWDRVMVGPAAWDLACLVASLPGADGEALTREYLKHLGERVEEFAGVEAFVAAVSRLRASEAL